MSTSLVRTGKFLINIDERVVLVDDQPVHLTGKEYGILELLSLRKGTILTKAMLLDHLYGGMDEPELKIIDVLVCKLRKKLAQATGGNHYIETVWGRGYVLRDLTLPDGRQLVLTRYTEPYPELSLLLNYLSLELPAQPPRKSPLPLHRRCMPTFGGGSSKLKHLDDPDCSDRRSWARDSAALRGDGKPIENPSENRPKGAKKSLRRVRDNQTIGSRRRPHPRALGHR